ncbi:putative protein transporter sec31 [Erysiphe necator]|uniref:Protein transport protein SEC31 n=1 Tax=Uncinula necator TaxID=52586 RepID=A0A0B1P947_UNCNE|nr:putative protein transporter sec31 [Erysiphe necator]
MACLRTITRTGTFSWNLDAGAPLLVTGTRAGAIDADFSDETKLELWDLSLDNPDQSVELQPIASYSTDSRFLDIAWSPPNEGHPRGIIAGALENGSLYLWDAEKFMNQTDNSLISQTQKHTGPIKSLQFNPLKPQILATAGTKGELFIYDINDISNPFRLGNAAARSDDLECVAWNRKVPHILATGGTGGFITVWDLKTKKASLTLNNNRKAVGAIAWDPENSTKLLTATPDDTKPVILLWDLRNSNAPECTLQGHNQGILSISWCQQDSNLLLSCGKDNRTILWNPQLGELLGEFPEATNWTFQTRFHPHNPALSATASFDGKISIQTLFNTNSLTKHPEAQDSVDGEDFFTKVQTQPQGTSFSLKKAPKWLEPPSGVSFGFGGKLISFSLTSNNTSKHRSSKIQISQYSLESEIESAIQNFEKTQKSGNFNEICQNHILRANSEEEKADWRIMETLIAKEPRKRVVDYLESSAIKSTAIDETESNDAKTIDKVDTTEVVKDLEDAEKKSTNKSRLSTLFADGVDSTDGENFLLNLSATKAAKTDNPFQLYSDSDSEAEKQITQALILGKFEKAMNICLEQNLIADALIIANCGGKSLLENAQSTYLSKKTEGPNYLRLLSAIIGKNLWDVVYNADLENWKETMVTLCTYADSGEFSDLCEALGDRILEHDSPRDASFCYLVGSKLEKVVPIWLKQLEEVEKAEVEKLIGDSMFSVHARNLQNFIEKVTVFRNVTGYKDLEQNVSSGWKLSPLYAKYIEYANIATTHGQLEIAERYLDLLPSGYPAVDIERNRVKFGLKKGFTAEVKMTQNQPNSIRPQSRPAMINTYEPTANLYESTGNISTTIPSRSSSYMTPSWTSAPQAPPSSRAKDTGQWNDTPLVVKPPAVRKASPFVGQNYAPPLNNQQPNLSMPPLTSQYNGRPVATPPPPPPKGPAPTQRIPTPRVDSPQQFVQRPPFTVNQYGSHMTPTQSHYVSPTALATNLHAPSIAPTSQYAPPVTPAANQYAPPVTSAANQYAPLIAPSSSQYAPSIVSTKNMYGPPTPQSVSNSNQYTPQIAPVASQFPPPANHNTNQFAPPATHNTNQFVPPATQNTNQFAPPATQNSSQNLPQLNFTPQISNQPSIAAPPKATVPETTTKVKYPAGDRSHIPQNARKMVEIFSQDMQRVASQAPSSFLPQVKDTQKRLNILFDHLNNEELIKADTIQRLNDLAEALVMKNYDLATRLQIDIQKEKMDECGNWMVSILL